jgi:hypothetical protein
MKASMSSKTLKWTAVGSIGTVLAIVVSVVLWASAASSSSPGQDPSGQTVNQGGQNNNQYVNNGSGSITVTASQFAQQMSGKTRAEAEALAQKYAEVPPPVPGPAPFTIVDAPHGVFIRSSGRADGRHVGAVTNNVTVWADCRAKTDFDPDPTDDTGPEWLRIRWHTDKTNDSLAAPQPTGPYAAWVYAGLTVPAGHNGQIPTCDRME